ncbi:protealysin inhibitor emfourin (plasmid) [Nostoc sp. UHCC 0302]|uniref:protealysin inhibitor emfourin n=1 Tax=Nostoc sp. UHCC 0302 TaxID=3134896 RepID=UPI00311CAEC5
MKVTLTKYGGLAAGILRSPYIVESSALPESVASELVRLVAAAKTASVIKEDKPGRARDAMSYTITIEEDGSEPTVISQSDITMSPSFAVLLQWLESHRAGK